jgi:hypothetical protein
LKPGLISAQDAQQFIAAALEGPESKRGRVMSKIKFLLALLFVAPAQKNATPKLLWRRYKQISEAHLDSSSQVWLA